MLGGGGEWPWLAEHFAGGYLLAGYLLAAKQAKQAICLQALCQRQTAPGY
jgi:hypothetical protein